MEGLDALEKIKNIELDRDEENRGYYLYEVYPDEYAAIEQELKSNRGYEALYKLEHQKNQHLTSKNLEMKEMLDIIKNKKVNFQVLYFVNTVEEYNRWVNQEDLTQEEFDLLKRYY